MSGQVIPFEAPKDKPVYCSFCKRNPAKNEQLLVNPDATKWMCMPCVVKAKKRIEETA